MRIRSAGAILACLFATSSAVRASDPLNIKLLAVKGRTSVVVSADGQPFTASRLERESGTAIEVTVAGPTCRPADYTATRGGVLVRALHVACARPATTRIIVELREPAKASLRASHDRFYIDIDSIPSELSSRGAVSTSGRMERDAAHEAVAQILAEAERLATRGDVRGLERLRATAPGLYSAAAQDELARALDEQLDRARRNRLKLDRGLLLRER